MIKTIKIKIIPTTEQIVALEQMTEQYRLACNYVSECIVNDGLELNAFKIQKILYTDVRHKFDLKAQMVISVFRTVVSKYKAVQEQLRQNPYQFKDDYENKYYTVSRDIDWITKPIYFHNKQIDLISNRDYSFNLSERLLSLNTLDKRIKLKYVDTYYESYFDGSWKFGTGKIVNKNDKWYLHIPCSKDNGNTFNKEHVKHIVGIDRGLRFIISTYDENKKCFFESGKNILLQRQKFAEYRKKLQKKHTWSSFKALRRLSRRENSWMTDVNHRISKALVDKYGPDTLFVLEDLTNVSFAKTNLVGTKKQIREKRSWAFYQLEQFLIYKAEAVGSKVIKISPRYTSQRCPNCGRIHKQNRDHKNHIFICDKCGYSSNDDRIGAMNIQLLGSLWVNGNNKPHFDIRKNNVH